ncbi:MAG: isochorismate synthase [Chlorobiaceae bacterium]
MSEFYHTITPTEETLPLKSAVAALKEAVTRFDHENGSECSGSRSRCITFRQPVLAADIPGWLCCQEAYPKIFWQNREKDFAVAGIGIADILSAENETENESNFDELQRLFDGKDPKARYFGGIRFNNNEKLDPLWNGFSSFTFILPLIELALENGSFSLSCRLFLENGDDFLTNKGRIISILDRVAPACDCSNSRVPDLLGITYNPDETGWKENCLEALRSFEESDMKKVALARQTILEFSATFPPLLFQLRYPYPDNAVYRFHFEPAAHHAFFSFSPERLYLRNGGKLLTEALAGTVSKKSNNGSDQDASDLLLNSEKDIREHKFVSEMIHNELSPVCSEVDMEKELHVLQLHRLAHLYTRCSATLKAEFRNDTAILKRLHPTPAVGGVPKAEAMKSIMELEPFTRGWYAAPVGWLSRDAAEFSVAIRSALVNERFVCLYSGAGLVKGSDPAAEWEEVEQKIGDILAITRQEA